MTQIKDPEDIAILYLSKKKLLLNIARTYLKNEEQAVNLVADVIVKMLEKERVFPNEQACLSYMKEIVRNGAKNALRKKREMLLWENATMESLINKIEEQQDEYEHINIKLFIQKLVEEYPYKIREAFVLHVLDGIPSSILAREMGIKHDTLRRQFTRMKKRLAELESSIRNDFLLLMLICQ